MPVIVARRVVPGHAADPLARREDPKVRIGMSIIDTPYRAPGVLAAELATIDHLSNGRLNVGVGSGWMPEEFAAASASHIFPKRHKHVRETIEIMQGIWTNDLFEYHGEFADFDRCGLRRQAAAAAAPPIYFSGLKDPKRSANRIAKYGLSGWIGIQDTPEEHHARGRARSSASSASSAATSLDELRHVQHDLVRHHRRGDRPDPDGQGQQPAGGHRGADHRQPQALQGGRA